jgi:hypothetical protein
MQTLVTTLAGQNANVAYPTRMATGRLIILVHGGGLDYEFACVAPANGSQAYTRFQELIDFLTVRGFVVACPALYDTSLPLLNWGDTFGNDASTTQLASVVTAAKALPNVSQGKYGLITFSAGCMTVANHVRRQGNSGIAGMLSICPAANIGWYRGTDASHGTGSTAGEAYGPVNQAHGIGGANGTTTPCDSAWNAIAAVKEPSVIAPTVTIPWAFWTSSNDPQAVPTQGALTMSALAASVGNGMGTWRDMGNTDTNVNIGHNTLNVNPVDVLNLLETWPW